MATAQPPSWPVPRAADVESIDAVMKAAYEAASAAPGTTRDADRLRSLFRPDATLTVVGRRDGKVQIERHAVDAFADRFSTPVPDGVFEHEISRRIQSFGDMAQVWSTYEIRATPESPQVRLRGINSLELVFDGERWWIVDGTGAARGRQLAPARAVQGMGRREAGRLDASQAPRRDLDRERN